MWAPWTAHTGDDGEEEEGGGGAHQHSNDQGQPFNLILDDLILLSTAILVAVIPTTEYIPSLLTRGAVKPSVPLAHQVYIPRTVFRTKDG